MRIDIVSILPQLMESWFADSILKRAIQKELVEIHFHDPREYSTDKHKRIDDYQFGGGAGMVMMVEPLSILIEKLKVERAYDAIVYMTPDGSTLKQRTANQFSSFENIMIICGHYKGIDDRIRQHYVTHEISIGDYVLSGGELAACVLCDSVIRLIPGVLNDGTSALTDSFQDGLLAPPVYTRPAEFNGWKVPEILTSGNFKAIEDWRHEQALERTKQRRPDLLED
jgi:tRNA (guanine37-N1)-methyltransferase